MAIHVASKSRAARWADKLAVDEAESGLTSTQLMVSMTGSGIRRFPPPKLKAMRYRVNHAVAHVHAANMKPNCPQLCLDELLTNLNQFIAHQP